MSAESENEAYHNVLKNYGDFFQKQYTELSEIIHERWDKNKLKNFVNLDLDTTETATITALVSTDNVIMSKIIATFSSLCIEIKKLKEEASSRHFTFISMLSQNMNEELTKLQNHIPQICQLAAFVDRCRSVLKNIFNQIFALYETQLFNLDNVQLHYILSHISELSAIIIIMEFLITNSSLSAAWNDFCKSIKSESNNFTPKSLKNISKAAANIQEKIMRNKIVDDIFNEVLMLKQNFSVRSTASVAKEIINYLKMAISNLERSSSETVDQELLNKCIKVNALYFAYCYVFGTSDKKVFKALIELDTKAHTIPLYGNSVWYPEQFLQQYFPSQFTDKMAQNIMKARQSFLTNKKQTFTKESTDMQILCAQWVLELERVFGDSEELNASEMGARAVLLLDGLDIACKISSAVRTIVSLHLSLSIPMTKSLLKSVFIVLELVKYLEHAVSRNNVGITLSISMIVQHFTYQGICFITSVKKNLMADKKTVNSKLDELTCLVVAERSLSGPVTEERLVTANMALSLLPLTTYTEETYSKLGLLLEKTQKVCKFLKIFHRYCNCSWLFWHKEVIPMYMMQNYVSKRRSQNLKAGMRIFEDCLYEIETKFGPNSRAAVKFRNDIESHIRQNIFVPMNQLLETNLRIQTHSYMHGTSSNELLPVNRTLLLEKYFQVYPKNLALGMHLEHYLSKMFYNLTTIVLSDWKTYAEMRQLAKFKYNIETVEDNLPKQTLEQGIDILYIMRKIDTFVREYCYNLNSQLFIERRSNNKHLNTVHIKHIANSIRTHGTGIMNTAVNYTYQFLRMKFSNFSKMMYDENIKSRLKKELRIHRDAVNKGNKMYTYKNGEHFIKDMKNVKIEANYIDSFREIITEIGNAMGYVRMIRSGGRHCCAEAIAYLPDMVNPINFKSKLEDLDLNSDIISAAAQVDNDIKSLITHFTQGTEYFKLLVDVFAPTFRNEKNDHLRNFYLLVPSLTLCHVEHMILCKDKMLKDDKDGACFTDDGFAIGLAYILRLLDQDTYMDSLYWFDSVWKYIAEERINISEERKRNASHSQQALSLTEKKLSITEVEFQLLFYTFSSSRIFFR